MVGGERVTSEAQKRATLKFQKEKCKQYTFKFNKNTDADIIEVLDTVSNRQGYLKGLIRADLRRRSR